MPITKKDVLKLLDDPIVGKIDFWVANIHVHPNGFDAVQRAIENEDIEVESGDDPDLAHYDPSTDTLITQKANPPLDASNRAALLHECAHAMVDLAEIEVTALTDEVTGYLVQVIYRRLVDPFAELGGNESPLLIFISQVVELVQKFKLDTPLGRGARLQWHDYEHLRPQLHRVDTYMNVDFDELSVSDGARVRNGRGTGRGSYAW